MTVGAIVLATAADRRSGDRLPRLRCQLARLGVESVCVVPPDAARLQEAVETSSGSILILDAGVVIQDQALASLVADPRVRTAALAAVSSPHGAAEPPLRLYGARVVSAGSSIHECSASDARFLGVLVVDAADRPALVAAAADVGSVRAAGPADLEALLLVALVRGGTVVDAVDLRRLFWARPTPEDEAATLIEVEALDEDRLWLDSAVKADDGFFGTFFVSPYSRFVARGAARRRIRPNVVTVLALVLALVSAVLFALGHRWDRVAGSVVLLVAFVLDCVDGQLARYTRTFTPLGAWLDLTTDRVKEYAVYAGLAVGASRVADVDLWVLAAVAMCLQTVRHLLDHTFPASRPAPHVVLPFAQPDDGGRPTVRRRPSWSHWPRKLLTLPIGERFAVICLTAAVWTPKVTFVVLLAWGAVAAVYGNTGRVLRSVR